MTKEYWKEGKNGYFILKLERWTYKNMEMQIWWQVIVGWIKIRNMPLQLKNIISCCSWDNCGGFLGRSTNTSNLLDCKGGAY